MKLPVCQCAKSTKCGNSFKANFIVRFYEFYIASHSLSTVMLAVAGTCATRRTQWSSSLQPAVTSLFGLGNVSLVRHQRPVGNGLNLAEWFSLLPLWALDKAKTPGSPSFGRPAEEHAGRGHGQTCKFLQLTLSPLDALDDPTCLWHVLKVS